MESIEVVCRFAGGLSVKVGQLTEVAPTVDDGFFSEERRTCANVVTASRKKVKLF